MRIRPVVDDGGECKGGPPRQGLQEPFPGLEPDSLLGEVLVQKGAHNLRLVVGLKNVIRLQFRPQVVIPDEVAVHGDGHLE